MGIVIWSLLLHFFVAQCGFARAALGEGGYNDTFVRQDLADNNAAGAARIVQDNVAPAVTSGDNTHSLTGTTALPAVPSAVFESPCFAKHHTYKKCKWHFTIPLASANQCHRCLLGAEPYPADTLDFLIRAAASAIQAGENEQPSVNTALQFLSRLTSVNQTALSSRLTQVFEDELAYSQIGTRRGPEYTHEVLLLSLSAGLSQAVYGAFTLVRGDVLVVFAHMPDPEFLPLRQQVTVSLRTRLPNWSHAIYTDLYAKVLHGLQIHYGFTFNSRYIEQSVAYEVSSTYCRPRETSLLYSKWALW